MVKIVNNRWADSSLRDASIKVGSNHCLSIIYKSFLPPMALKGLKVIEIAGLAPAPFCGMIFSDFGANVIRIEKVILGYARYKNNL